MRRTAATLLACLALAAHASSTMAVRVLDWMVPVPAGWTPQVPSSPMRLAQFTAGSRDGSADAAVFHFGLAGGGSVQENIDRWASQFLTEAGQPATPRIEKGNASGMPVTWVAIDGRYARGVGTETILTVVNLDPHGPQEGLVTVPYELGVPPVFEVTDLLEDTTHTWRMGGNYVRLDPAERPAHVLRVEARA